LLFNLRQVHTVRGLSNLCWSLIERDELILGYKRLLIDCQNFVSIDGQSHHFIHFQSRIIILFCF